MADIIVSLSEQYFFKPLVYGPDPNPSFPEGWWVRELTTLFLAVLLGAYVLYFSTAGLNYYFLYDREGLQREYDKKARGEKTPLIANQVRAEILYTMGSAPFMSFMTAFIFLAELRGYSLLYDDVQEYGWGYLLFSVPLFLLFTDCLIYFIHRALHQYKFLYVHIHKPHHRWIITTPFASHAFHPMDGFLQGLPYHIFVFVFPFHKILYLCMFVAVNVWTVSIHDESYQVPSFFENVINGAAHHTTHHIKFFYNYGQYFTLWDILGGTYRNPFDNKDVPRGARALAKAA